MTEAEVRCLCIKSRELFLSQPILLELEAPLKICGELIFIFFPHALFLWSSLELNHWYYTGDTVIYSIDIQYNTIDLEFSMS